MGKNSLKSKLFFGFLVSFTAIFANNANLPPEEESITFKCNQVFENRKQELVQILDGIHDEKQVLESLNEASKSVLERKEIALAEKEKRLKEQEKIIDIKTARLNQLIAENQRILDEIKELIENKIRDTYSKMSPSKAAGILDTMEDAKAAGILFLLKPKDLSSILAKMTPTKASIATELIRQGPPFKADISSFAIKTPDGIEKAIEADFQ